VFSTNKVLWKEGMFLQPHHFQQLERNFTKIINERFEAQSAFIPGFLTLNIDTEALSNELFSISNCAGILPDGTFFDLPQDTPAPPARSFADHFTAEQQLIDVYLGLPIETPGKVNIGTPQSRSHATTRHISQTEQITDQVLGDTRKDIETITPAFTILFAGESLDNYSCLRIARLTRDSNGQVQLMEKHVPPLLNIEASPWIQNEIKTLMQIFMAKISSLSQGRKQVEGGFAGFSSGEETAFRLLQVLNTHTPLISHFQNRGGVHPYELFKAMLQYAGALCTFSSEFNITQLPKYDHNNLMGTFESVHKIIKGVLTADISAGCVTIPVQQINQATYSCDIKDEKLLTRAKFFLGITGNVSEKELIIGVIQRVKMSSRDRLELLISSAMPGLRLMNVSKPPEGLSTKPGYVYFALDQQGEFWEGIKTARSIAFYFPNNFPGLKIEMLALKA